MADQAIRCAVYTRKSSEEGLEQGFNSLHAQREACEAYVLSQAGEGWTALNTAYEDGGYSGGSTDRPGLKALLTDIAAATIDVVVVYKVDRLTRSLADFAEIVKAFDAAGVSFVSVTQAFNTTTSMGRLTLNMLLSFAQFEREVTGERIRDKIAASKAKGMWMGGRLPLGYDAPDDPQSRALVVNEAEAETVRLIFRKYLELRSVNKLREWLAGQGVRSKVFHAASGRTLGGLPFGTGALYHLLKNRTYLGDIPHKLAWHRGRHAPILDQDAFEAAQKHLADNARQRRKRAARPAGGLLKGLIFDLDGHPMSPTVAKGKTALYRYYVSAPLLKGAPVREDPEAIRRVPANAIEELVQDRLARFAPYLRGQALDIVRRVDVLPGAVVIRLAAEPLAAADDGDVERLRRRLDMGDELELDGGELRLKIPVRLKLRSGRTWLMTPDGRNPAPRPRIDPALTRALRTARDLARRHHLRPPARSEYQVRALAVPACPYERKIIRLAFLAPDLQRAVLEGRQPPMLTLDRLLREDIPDAWDDQRRAFGFA